MSKHTPGPWQMSRPMGTEHLRGGEPSFWVSADRTLHLWVSACADGYVSGENEANARLIAAAPDLLSAAYAIDGASEYMEFDPDSRFGEALSMIVAAIAKAAGHE